jgi:hypothetical protein
VAPKSGDYNSMLMLANQFRSAPNWVAKRSQVFQVCAQNIEGFAPFFRELHVLRNPHQKI